MTSAWRRHHATGSGHDGYLDPELIVSIPVDAHDEVHGLWRGVGIDRPDAVRRGPALVARFEVRFRRLSATVDVVGGLLASAANATGVPIVVATAVFLCALSHALQQWADECAEFLDGEDAS
jgi:hypothetical protein